MRLQVEISGEPAAAAAAAAAAATTIPNRHPTPTVPKTPASVAPTSPPLIVRDDDDDEDGVDSQLEAVLERAPEPPRARRDLQLIEMDSTETIASASTQRATQHGRLKQDQHMGHAHQHALAGAHRATFHAAENSLHAVHPRGLERSLIEAAVHARTRILRNDRKDRASGPTQEKPASVLETRSHLHLDNFMQAAARTAERHVVHHLELAEGSGTLRDEQWHSADNENSHVVHHVPMA
jgi:hypothetical protein